MRSALARLGNIIRLIDYVERFVATTAVFVISGIVISQVFFRYFLADPIVWVEEFSIALFIWMSFVGTSIALKRNRHIAIQTFVGKLPRRGRVFVRAICSLLIAVVAASMAYYAAEVLPIENQTRTTTLPIDIPKGWMFSGAMMVSAGLMLITAVYFFLCGLVGYDLDDQLPGINWSTHPSSFEI